MIDKGEAIKQTTYRQNLQQQTDVGSAHQKLPHCIAPSYVYHINEAAFEKDLQQSIYFLCKSGIKISTFSFTQQYNIAMGKKEDNRHAAN